MTYDWIAYLTVFLALWSAVIGGVFSAFSEFIMKGLLRADTASGIASMQQINKTVIPTQFVAGILIIPFLSIALAIHAVFAFGFDRDGVLALILAPVIFIPTVFLMTMFGNVPMNNRLDALNPNTAEAATYWTYYRRRWTRFNHVRTIGSLATAIVYFVAAFQLG